MLIVNMFTYKILKSTSRQSCCLQKLSRAFGNTNPLNQKAVFPELNKQRRMIDKIMNNTRPDKLTPDMIGIKMGTASGNRRGQFLGRHRLSTLTNVLLETITDIMSTGSVYPELSEKNLEVTKVGLSKNGDTVKVYWRCDKSKDDQDIHDMLKKAAPLIRHEILEMHLLGHVPYIEFVPDATASSLAVLDKLFQEADYGEDYEPLDSQIHANNYAPPPITESLRDRVNRELAEKNIKENDDMKMDVFGLDHMKIMHKVKTKLSRTGKSSRSAPASVQETTDASATQFPASKNFEKYLIDKRKKQLKQQKEKKIEMRNVTRLEDEQYDAYVDSYEDVNVENDEYDDEFR